MTYKTLEQILCRETLHGDKMIERIVATCPTIRLRISMFPISISTRESTATTDNANAEENENIPIIPLVEDMVLELKNLIRVDVVNLAISEIEKLFLFLKENSSAETLDLMKLEKVLYHNCINYRILCAHLYLSVQEASILVADINDYVEERKNIRVNDLFIANSRLLNRLSNIQKLFIKLVTKKITENKYTEELNTQLSSFFEHFHKKIMNCKNDPYDMLYYILAYDLRHS